MNTIDLELDNDPVMSIFKQTNDSPPAVFHDDPVALSCAAYRIGNYPRLEHIVVTAEDRALAVQVRKHFMDKLVMQRLQGKQLSPFREKLGSFLVDNRPLKEDEIGILYCIPHFYFEDINVQELIDSVAQVEPSQSVLRSVTLNPLKTIDLKRRGGVIRQYWWTDSDRKPYCLFVRRDADHQPLYQSLWDLTSITIDAHMFTKSFIGTNRWFYKLVGMQLKGINNG